MGMDGFVRVCRSIVLVALSSIALTNAVSDIVFGGSYPVSWKRITSEFSWLNYGGPFEYSYFAQTHISWESAQAKCRSGSGSLIVPRNSIESGYITSRTNSAGLIYIGVHSVSGVWVSADDRLPVRYEDWSGGVRPTNFSCAAWNTSSNSSWMGVDCAQVLPYGFVCQRPARIDCDRKSGGFGDCPFLHFSKRWHAGPPGIRHVYTNNYIYYRLVGERVFAHPPDDVIIGNTRYQYSLPCRVIITYREGLRPAFRCPQLRVTHLDGTVGDATRQCSRDGITLSVLVTSDLMKKSGAVTNDYRGNFTALPLLTISSVVYETNNSALRVGKSWAVCGVRASDKDSATVYVTSHCTRGHTPIVPCDRNQCEVKMICSGIISCSVSGRNVSAGVNVTYHCPLKNVGFTMLCGTTASRVPYRLSFYCPYLTNRCRFRIKPGPGTKVRSGRLQGFLVFRCDEGYQFNENVTVGYPQPVLIVLFCLKNNEWHKPYPVCVRKPNILALDPYHHSRIRVAYNCSDGMTHTLPCEGNKCEIEILCRNVTSCSASGGNFRAGVNVTFYCRHKYRNTTFRTLCSATDNPVTADGGIICLNCKPLPYDNRTTFQFLSGSPFGSEATYRCRHGHKFNESVPGDIYPHHKVTSTCLESGQWSRGVPVCIEVNCPALSTPSNGTILYEQTGSRYGDRVIYTCLPGYMMIYGLPTGERLIASGFYCARNGKWTGNVPVCIKEPIPTTQTPRIPPVFQATATMATTANPSTMPGLITSSRSAWPTSSPTSSPTPATAFTTQTIPPLTSRRIIRQHPTSILPVTFQASTTTRIVLDTDSSDGDNDDDIGTSDGDDNDTSADDDGDIDSSGGSFPFAIIIGAVGGGLMLILLILYAYIRRGHSRTRSTWTPTHKVAVPNNLAKSKAVVPLTYSKHEDGNELTHTPIGSQLSVDESSLSHITASNCPAEDDTRNQRRSRSRLRTSSAEWSPIWTYEVAVPNNLAEHRNPVLLKCTTTSDRDCDAEAHVPDESHCGNDELRCNDDESTFLWHHASSKWSPNQTCENAVPSNLAENRDAVLLKYTATNDRDCNARAHVPDESHCSEKESYCKDDETYCKDDESHCSEKKSYCKDDETYCKDDESHCSEKESYCKDDESHCSEKESYCEGDESHLKDEKSSFSKRPFRSSKWSPNQICENAEPGNLAEHRAAVLLKYTSTNDGDCSAEAHVLDESRCSDEESSFSKRPFSHNHSAMANVNEIPITREEDSKPGETNDMQHEYVPLPPSLTPLERNLDLSSPQKN